MSAAPILLLDMDGPLADFDQAFYDRCIENGWKLDVDGPAWQTARYFTDHIPDRSERKQARAMVDAPGWFASLPVTPGAVAGVADLVDVGFDVWVCTKPLDSSPTCVDEKRRWLAQHFPTLTRRMIVAPDKSLIRGDLLLDDAIKPEWIGRAVWAPVVFSAPFNHSDPRWAGLPRWRWGLNPDRLLGFIQPKADQ